MKNTQMFFFTVCKIEINERSAWITSVTPPLVPSFVFLLFLCVALRCFCASVQSVLHICIMWTAHMALMNTCVCVCVCVRLHNEHVSVWGKVGECYYPIAAFRARVCVLLVLAATPTSVCVFLYENQQVSAFKDDYYRRFCVCECVCLLVFASQSALKWNITPHCYENHILHSQIRE